MREDFAQINEVAMTALALIEIACWDIVGKALDQPVYRLLGGAVRERVKAYANGWYTVERTPGKKMGPPEMVTGAELEALKTDDARVMQQTRITVTIDAIEMATGSVTYHGSDNRRVFRIVQDRKLLEGLSVGDVVTITHARAQAVSVDRVP